MVNSTLDHQTAAVIILTVQARDKNAVENVDEQITKVEVTVYIQAYNELNPNFTVGSWSPSDPTIRVSEPEEKPVGSIVLVLSAIDSVNNLPISTFVPSTRLPSGFAVHTSGNIELTERLDFENMENKTLSFRVQALSDDQQRVSVALVLLIVEDINDHTPQFLEQKYHGSVIEGANKGTPVLTVKATDGDLARTPQGFGDIRYSLTVSPVNVMLDCLILILLLVKLRKLHEAKARLHHLQELLNLVE
ncbi:cadherin-related family member 1-like [Lycorma delicatula]|uniref:cadherin-related family member 1-like n=1 Tax=Lycorma delicatula TaxID=130591 RepID=UPI003F5180AC